MVVVVVVILRSSMLYLLLLLSLMVMLLFRQHQRFDLRLLVIEVEFCWGGSGCAIPFSSQSQLS